MSALKSVLHSWKYRVLCPVLCRVSLRLWRKVFLRRSSFQPLPLYDLRVRHSMMDFVLRYWPVATELNYHVPR